MRDYVYAGGRLLAAMKPASGAAVSFQAGASVVSEAVSPHNLTVVLATPSPSPCSVQVDYTMSSGTAEAGKDFILASGIVTFPPNSPNGATQSIPVTILNDGLDEGDESFTMQLSGTGTLRQHVVTIQDEDPLPMVSIGPASSNVVEGDVGLIPVSLTVSLSTPSGRVVTVNYATGAGTGPSPATSGVDFQAATGVVTFPKESAAGQPVTVKVIGDTLEELEQDFTHWSEWRDECHDHRQSGWCCDPERRRPPSRRLPTSTGTTTPTSCGTTRPRATADSTCGSCRGR